ncbi:hypothetical protein BT96DRAFT_1014244 [Gymnopus androsaceus JB14]|uniref:Uncharacterized protein n=1 Tax=Gymnopus androsaceus JB14 TaxID=1447944 RepID=A0A6A4IA05_9AGAR|nr:hypothetical protein BT96DRAFT_1014244 [Gymnopus androsaceus JB14]
MAYICFLQSATLEGILEGQRIVMPPPSPLTPHSEGSRRITLPRLLNPQEGSAADSETHTRTMKQRPPENCPLPNILTASISRVRETSQQAGNAFVQGGHGPTDPRKTLDLSENHPTSGLQLEHPLAVTPYPPPYLNMPPRLDITNTDISEPPTVTPTPVPFEPRNQTRNPTSPTWGYAADNREALAQCQRAITNTIRMAESYSDSYKRMIKPP